MTDVTSAGPAQFGAAVLSSFVFLETNYGFESRVPSRDGNSLLIRYETPALYVALMYGPPAYEPEMSFGRRGIDDIPGGYSFEAGDLVQLDCCKNWTWNKNYPNHTVGLVAEFARILAECGAECLAGNPATFDEMKDRRNKLIAEHRRREHTKNLRIQIAAARDAKDYKGIVELYSSIDDLSELDEKLLHFAKSHV